MPKVIITVVLLSLFHLLCVGLLYGDGESEYAAFLSALEKVKKKEFTEILIDELTRYTRLFPDAGDVDDLHFKLASTYHEQGQKVESFYTHLQLLYLYPESEHISAAKDRIRTTMFEEKKLEPLRDKVDAILNPSLIDTTLEGANYAFIRDVFEFNVESVNELLTGACEEFIDTFSGSERQDDVIFWHAELLLRNERYERALAEYMKLTFLFNRSLFVSASKIKMADIFSEQLDMHQEAILTLEEFLVEYPDDPQAPYAQMHVAQILENKKKTYIEAINAYTAVAEKYPQSLEAVPSLFEAARLYEDKFKEYNQAIRVFAEIVRDFPMDLKAPYALTEAARIYEKRLQDYPNAANVYAKVYRNYPQSSIAPQALYAAAEITENKLKNFEKALTYYRAIVDEYPADKLAGDASKRIEKLTEEIKKKE